MSSGATVVASGPNSTVSMIQSMVRSWQKESQDQIDKDIASLKANPTQLRSGALFIGQVSSAKLTAAIISSGLAKNGATNDDETWSLNVAEAAGTEFVRENSMSSQEISDALYSGRGITNEFCAAIGGQSSTFTLGSFIQQLVAGDNTLFAGQISQAMVTHSLVIQKASDVASLNYRMNFAYAASEGGTSGGSEQSWNEAATGVSVENGKYVSNVASDGKHHFMLSPTGDLDVYLSW